MDFTRECNETVKVLASILPDADTTIWVETEGDEAFHVRMHADFGDLDPVEVKISFSIPYLRGMPARKRPPFIRHWLMEGVKEVIAKSGRTISL